MKPKSPLGTNKTGTNKTNDPAMQGRWQEMNRRQRRETIRKIQSEDSVDVMTATTIISEAGYDMSKWETENHFVSWLRLCPDNRISGGKIIGKGRLPTNNRATVALKMAASTLRLSDTYLGAQFRRLRTKLGAPCAIKALSSTKKLCRNTPGAFPRRRRQLSNSRATVRFCSDLSRVCLTPTRSHWKRFCRILSSSYSIAHWT